MTLALSSALTNYGTKADIDWQQNRSEPQLHFPEACERVNYGAATSHHNWCWTQSLRMPLSPELKITRPSAKKPSWINTGDRWVQILQSPMGESVFEKTFAWYEHTGDGKGKHGENRGWDGPTMHALIALLVMIEQAWRWKSARYWNVIAKSIEREPSRDADFFSSVLFCHQTNVWHKPVQWNHQMPEKLELWFFHEGWSNRCFTPIE